MSDPAHEPVIQPTHHGFSIDLKRADLMGTYSCKNPEASSMTRANASTPIPTPRSNEEIAEVLRKFVGHRSFSQVSRDAGVHRESVRRYLSGTTRIPAEFVAAVCNAYCLDAMEVLVKDAKGPYRSVSTHTPDERLSESLSDALKPAMARWMRESIVPHGAFLRSLSDHAG